VRPLKRPHSFHDQDHQNVAAESRIGKKPEPANGERVTSAAALCACLRQTADGWLIVPGPHRMNLLARLVDGLDDAEARETDPERKSRLRDARSVLAGTAKDVMAEVIAKVLLRAGE